MEVPSTVPRRKLVLIPELEQGVFYLAHGALDDPDSLLEHILSTPHDVNSGVVLYGKTFAIPRRQFAVGDKGTSYTFSGATVQSRDWSPRLMALREEIKAKTKFDYNFALINIYDTGKNVIHYHSDDEKDLDPAFPIASISLGATRGFLIKENIPGALPKKAFKIDLEHNDLLLMGENSQKNYKHAVPARSGVTTPRVNITMRRIR